MTIAIPRRLRENQPRSAIEAAEGLPMGVLDADPRVAGLLERRAAADERHRQAVEWRTARLERIEQSRQRLAQAESELARLEAEFPALARRFALTESTDGDLGTHFRAVQSWQLKAQALRAGVAALEAEAAQAVRGDSYGRAVSDLDTQIEETRAVVALELARRAA